MNGSASRAYVSNGFDLIEFTIVDLIEEELPRESVEAYLLRMELEDAGAVASELRAVMAERPLVRDDETVSLFWDCC